MHTHTTQSLDKLIVHSAALYTFHTYAVARSNDGGSPVDVEHLLVTLISLLLVSLVRVGLEMS